MGDRLKSHDCILNSVFVHQPTSSEVLHIDHQITDLPILRDRLQSVLRESVNADLEFVEAKPLKVKTVFLGSMPVSSSFTGVAIRFRRDGEADLRLFSTIVIREGATLARNQSNTAAHFHSHLPLAN